MEIEVVDAIHKIWEKKMEANEETGTHRTGRAVLFRRSEELDLEMLVSQRPSRGGGETRGGRGGSTLC
jgi:hypothetical protein